MCGNEKRSLPDTERLRSQVKPYSIKAKARAIKATVNRKNRRMCELSQRSRSLVQDAGASLASPPVPKNFPPASPRSEEHTSELQSLMRTSYAVFCLKTKKNKPRIYESILET